MTNNISLYFHIPFCVRKCHYCAFYSLPNMDDDIKQRYFKALQRQIDLFETDKTVSTVYFGGGTPPVLGVERLCELIRQVKGKFNLAADCEITLEVNPGTVDFCDLQRLFNAGFNRLSVGIQAADDEILGSIGRIHSFKAATECIENARKAGFNNISGDIMFALPNQGVEGFVNGLLNIMSTNLDHISAYSLQIEEGTRIFANRNSLAFPDEDVEEEQYNALCRILKEKGYNHYEISNFAKPDMESRHNSNYWLRGEYFGFGAAAHSFYMGKRFSAVCDLNEFIEKSNISALAPTDFHSAPLITPQEAAEEIIMLGLRTSYGASIPEDRYAIAERIAKMGYGSFENGVLRLNSKGFRVSNEIIGEILV